MSTTTVLVLPILCLVVGAVLVLVIVAVRADAGDLPAVLQVMRDIVRDLARRTPLNHTPSTGDAQPTPDEDGDLR